MKLPLFRGLLVTCEMKLCQDYRHRLQGYTQFKLFNSGKCCDSLKKSNQLIGALRICYLCGLTLNAILLNPFGYLACAKNKYLLFEKETHPLY